MWDKLKKHLFVLPFFFCSQTDSDEKPQAPQALQAQGHFTTNFDCFICLASKPSPGTPGRNNYCYKNKKKAIFIAIMLV